MSLYRPWCAGSSKLCFVPIICVFSELLEFKVSAWEPPGAAGFFTICFRILKFQLHYFLANLVSMDRFWCAGSSKLCFVPILCVFSELLEFKVDILTAFLVWIFFNFLDQCLVWFIIVLGAYGFLYCDRKSVFWHSHFSFHLCPITIIVECLHFMLVWLFLASIFFMFLDPGLLTWTCVLDICGSVSASMIAGAFWCIQVY